MQLLTMFCRPKPMPMPRPPTMTASELKSRFITLNAKKKPTAMKQ